MGSVLVQDPDVVDDILVRFQFLNAQLAHRVFHRFHLIQVIGQFGVINASGNIGLFPGDLIGIHDKLLVRAGQDSQHQEADH